MYLLRNERKLLNILRKNEPNFYEVFTYSYLEDNFYSDDVDELYVSIRSLSKKEPKIIDIAINQDDIPIGVVLENTGIHFKEYIAIKISSAAFFYIIGIISTLITEFLLGLL